MRIKWCAFAGMLCSLIAIAQSSSATTLKFTGTTGSSVDVGNKNVNVYPYDFSVDGSSTTTQLMCLNFNREITQGESWTVDADTIEEAANGSSMLLKSYEEDAWLFSQITPGASQAEQTLIQFAVWDILDPSGVGTHSDPYWDANKNAIRDLINQASDAIGDEDASFFDQFTIYVPNEPSNYYSSRHGYPDGVPQTFIGEVSQSPSPAPEPGSLALLGTSLLGMGGVVRRKLRRA